jgi:predicted transcriptional regulator
MVFADAPLSRREREVMAILHRKGAATAVDVRRELRDAPTDPAVRSILRILERKGHVEHRVEGRRYVFEPRLAVERARRSALRHLVETFFGGSPGDAIEALVQDEGGRLTAEEIDRLSRMLDRDREA